MLCHNRHCHWDGGGLDQPSFCLSSEMVWGPPLRSYFLFRTSIFLLRRFKAFQNSSSNDVIWQYIKTHHIFWRNKCNDPPLWRLQAWNIWEWQMMPTISGVDFKVMHKGLESLPTPPKASTPSQDQIFPFRTKRGEWHKLWKHVSHPSLCSHAIALGSLCSRTN